ncbi:hypothetical protein AB0K74_34350 [Streptomyces sp. NPDC056159]|uniref:hypothetical protein n=1 Tax=unclassified Streptomyces TaxID=2593676 RepID=UPI00342C2472
MADTTEVGDLALRRALALVRGRPYAGMDPQRYAWAGPVIQELVSAFTDVAGELSTRRREAGDRRAEHGRASRLRSAAQRPRALAPGQRRDQRR